MVYQKQAEILMSTNQKHKSEQRQVNRRCSFTSFRTESHQLLCKRPTHCSLLVPLSLGRASGNRRSRLNHSTRKKQKMKRPVPGSRPNMQSYIMTCPCVSFKERTFLKHGVLAEGKLVLRPQCCTAGDISRRAMLLLAAHCTQRLDPGDSSSSLARRGGGGGGGYEGGKAVTAAKGNLGHRCSGPHRSMGETVLVRVFGTTGTWRWVIIVVVMSAVTCLRTTLHIQGQRWTSVVCVLIIITFGFSDKWPLTATSIRCPFYVWWPCNLLHLCGYSRQSQNCSVIDYLSGVSILRSLQLVRSQQVR